MGQSTSRETPCQNEKAALEGAQRNYATKRIQFEQDFGTGEKASKMTGALQRANEVKRLKDAVAAAQKNYDNCLINARLRADNL
jgi:hypothetical protein